MALIKDLEFFLEKIDSYRNGFFYKFVTPRWPRAITPNHISWLRAIIGAILFALLFVLGIENKNLIFGLFAFGALTDLVDGPVARGTNRVTEFGAMLDSTADRIFLLPIAVYSLWGHYKWLLVILGLFELANALTAIYYKSREIYLESNIFGKTKMVLFCIVFIVMLIVWPEPPPEFFIYMLWATIPFTLLSAFTRIRANETQLKNIQHAHSKEGGI